MAASGRVKAWKELLQKHISLPVAFDRQQREPSKSLSFNLTIKTIDGIKTKVRISNDNTFHSPLKHYMCTDPFHSTARFKTGPSRLATARQALW